MKAYAFDPLMAEKYGLVEAVLIYHFQYWIDLNRSKGVNLHDGRTWSYQTLAQMSKHFRFLTYAQVRYACESLVKQGVLRKGNYNKSKNDHTTWYAFEDESAFLYVDVAVVVEETGEVSTAKISSPTAKKRNRAVKISRALPDNNPDDTAEKGETPLPPQDSTSIVALATSAQKDPPFYMHLLSGKMRENEAFVEAWKTYLRMRDKLGKKARVDSEDMAKRLIKTLHQHRDPVGLMDLSIEGKWRGLITDAYDKRYGNTGFRTSNNNTGSAYQRRAIHNVGDSLDAYEQYARDRGAGLPAT